MTTVASEPAPATPISGRAEIRLVKYSAGIERSLACWTTGVVPIARSGLRRVDRGEVVGEAGAVLDRDAVRLEPVRSGSDHGVFGQAVPTYSNVAPLSIEQAGDEQFGAFVARDGDPARDRRPGERAADLGQRGVLGGIGQAPCAVPVAAPIASSHAAVPSRPTGAEPTTLRPAASNSRTLAV